jgi:hypothetical protein
VIARFCSFGALDHQRRVFHQSSLPYLSENRDSSSYHYLKTTQKRKPESVEQSTRRKKTPRSKKRLDETLHGQCLCHPKSKHSSFECQVRGPLELRQVYEEKRRDYLTNDLLINFVLDSRRFPEGHFGVLFV